MHLACTLTNLIIVVCIGLSPKFTVKQKALISIGLGVICGIIVNL